MQTIINSFSNAFKGIFYFFKNERNGKIEIFIFLFALFLACLFQILIVEIIIIIFCGMLVLALEMINSAIEILCNEYDAHYNKAIKLIKDISAGAVLWASIGSVFIGALIFTPYFINYLK